MGSASSIGPAAASGSGPVPLGAEDLAILALESDTLAGHTCKVLRLGPEAPTVPQLRARIAARMHLAPALARRLDADRAQPSWVPDPSFDIANHVVEHRHHDPVDSDGLHVCVARLFEQRLNRERPLWQMDVIELEPGQRALVWRIHHALADGTAAVRYARALLWDDSPEQSLARSQVTARHAADDARRRGHLAGYVRRELRRSRAASPFDGAIGTRREVAFAAVSLSALARAVRAIDGATLNDAVLTVVTGALRHWVQTHHGHLGSLRVKVPVSLHHEGDSAANHDSAFSLALPLGEADPVARLRLIHARTLARKQAGDAERRELLLHQISHVSPQLEQFALTLERNPRRFALNVSNVRGPREPVTVLSAPVRQMHSLAEISRHHALRISVISLADLLCFGFCADADLVADLPTMAAHVEPEARALQDALTYC